MKFICLVQCVGYTYIQDARLVMRSFERFPVLERFISTINANAVKAECNRGQSDQTNPDDGRIRRSAVSYQDSGATVP